MKFPCTPDTPCGGGLSLDTKFTVDILGTTIDAAMYRCVGAGHTHIHTPDRGWSRYLPDSPQPDPPQEVEPHMGRFAVACHSCGRVEQRHIRAKRMLCWECTAARNNAAQWKRRHPVALALALLLSAGAAGCAPTNISQMVEAMGRDPATVCVQVNTIYGTLRASRTNIVDGEVSCSSDGVQVKSRGTTSIPVTITPRVNDAR